MGATDAADECNCEQALELKAKLAAAEVRVRALEAMLPRHEGQLLDADDVESIHGAGQAHGAAAERAAVVAWLQADAAKRERCVDERIIWALEGAAEDIESGAHVAREDKP